MNDAAQQLKGAVSYFRISNYGLGRGEPPLPVLLAYAPPAGILTGVLIDGELDLPSGLPSPDKERGRAQAGGPQQEAVACWATASCLS